MFHVRQGDCQHSEILELYGILYRFGNTVFKNRLKHDFEMFSHTVDVNVFPCFHHRFNLLDLIRYNIRFKCSHHNRFRRPTVYTYKDRIIHAVVCGEYPIQYIILQAQSYLQCCLI